MSKIKTITPENKLPDNQTEVDSVSDDQPSSEIQDQNLDGVNTRILNKDEFNDKFFETIKKALKEEWPQLKAIHHIQTGTRLILYQGTKSNVYGTIEWRKENDYKIRIHNSGLLRFFKNLPMTQHYFHNIL